MEPGAQGRLFGPRGRHSHFLFPLLNLELNQRQEARQQTEQPLNEMDSDDVF